MTDNEIIKALEDEIHLTEYVDSNYCSNVKLEIIKSALDLITRQQEEIENYKHLDVILHTAIDKISADIKSEAVKEFAERVKKRMITKSNLSFAISLPIATISDIDDLVKEMVGDK